jgi:hypothetical protein
MEAEMKRIFVFALLIVLLSACSNNDENEPLNNDLDEKIEENDVIKEVEKEFDLIIKPTDSKIAEINYIDSQYILDGQTVGYVDQFARLSLNRLGGYFDFENEGNVYSKGTYAFEIHEGEKSVTTYYNGQQIGEWNLSYDTIFESGEIYMVDFDLAEVLGLEKTWNPGDNSILFIGTDYSVRDFGTINISGYDLFLNSKRPTDVDVYIHPDNGNMVMMSGHYDNELGSFVGISQATLDCEMTDVRIIVRNKGRILYSSVMKDVIADITKHRISTGQIGKFTYLELELPKAGYVISDDGNIYIKGSISESGEITVIVSKDDTEIDRGQFPIIDGEFNIQMPLKEDEGVYKVEIRGEMNPYGVQELFHFYVLKQELMKVNLSDSWNELWDGIVEEGINITLSLDQIAQVNEVIAPIFTDTNGNITVNPISCFFTSYYNSPEDMDFANFLRYFPYHSNVNDVEEFNCLKLQGNWPFAEELETIPVPIHRYLTEEVEQVLLEFVGVELEDMNGVGFDELLYLEDYNAYYNFTSDFGPGIFNCTSGEVTNSTIKLYEEHGTYKVAVLTLEKQNGRYVIVSHQEMDTTSQNELECNVIEFDYTDTFLGGKESFPTYGNLVKTFGEPTEVRNVTDEDEVPIYGYFSALVYDDIEFVFPCSGNENDKFFIKDNDRVCRVDITGDKYSLDGSFFGGMGIGSSADEIVEFLDKEIRGINYSDPYSTCLEIVVIRFRNDVDKYNYERGIYFSGEMDTGLALGVVYLIDDNDEVVRIVMGWPTAG